MAYNGRWKEAEDGVTLEDVDPEIFSIFLHWLYAQCLPIFHDEIIRFARGTPAAKGDREVCKWSHLLVLKAYVFGDRFMAQKFKDHARNLCVNLVGEASPFYELVIYAFPNLCADDPLLDFLVDMPCLLWDPTCDRGEQPALRDKLPNHFLVRVMLRNFELKKQPIAIEDINLCSYHVHDSKEEREDCIHNPAKKAETT